MFCCVLGVFAILTPLCFNILVYFLLHFCVFVFSFEIVFVINQGTCRGRRRSPYSRQRCRKRALILGLSSFLLAWWEVGASELRSGELKSKPKNSTISLPFPQCAVCESNTICRSSHTSIYSHGNDDMTHQVIRNDCSGHTD